jgi:adenylylsulfate kinase
MIYWFTGQPGAGKTTLANWMMTHFVNNCIIVDGDDIRAIYDNKDYSEAGRRKNIELAQNLARFLHHKGFNVMVSLVSPYRDQREGFKTEMGEYIKEVYVHTKNQRGREGYHVNNYEPPLENFIDVDTTDEREFDTFQKLRSLI